MVLAWSEGVGSWCGGGSVGAIVWGSVSEVVGRGCWGEGGSDGVVGGCSSLGAQRDWKLVITEGCRG